jgi:hypothetical protein
MTTPVSTQSSATRAPSLTRSPTTLLDRRSTLGEHLCVQRDASGAAAQPTAASLVRKVVHSPGQPLDATTRAVMEPQVGYDLSRVRVHTDQQAADSARAVGAHAYTTGTHVAFAAGQYAPATVRGQQMLAHELTHVAQQARGPVSSTPVGAGLSVSDPGDRFEQSARRAGTEATLQANDGPRGDASQAVAPLPEQANGESRVIQRFNDSSPDSNYTERTTKATEAGASAGVTSANAGVASAVIAGAGLAVSLGSLLVSIRAANLAERQTQAAEDPPVAEPTTGGITSNHVELPEVKGVSTLQPQSTGTSKTKTTKPGKVDLNADLKTGESSESKGETTEGKGTSKTTTKGSATGTVKGPITGDIDQGDTETENFAPTGDADQEKQFKVLGLTAEAGNSAEFLLTLRYNGTDVRGGATEDGDISGYLGGSANSNASVTFRGSPGGHIPSTKNGAKKGDFMGTVRLLFGGTNVPPRKVPGQSTGFLGLGGGTPLENKSYNVQRFSFGAKFAADGKFVGFDHTNLRDRAGTKPVFGDGEKQPLVTVSLSKQDGAQPLQEKKEK